MGACKHGWECRFFGRGCVGLMEGLLVVVRFLVREVESLSFFLQLWWIERFGAGNGSALVYGNCKSTAVSSHPLNCLHLLQQNILLQDLSWISSRPLLFFHIDVTLPREIAAE